MALPNTSTEEELPEIPGPGELIAGKYQVEGVVGTGGMGVVLSARHVQLGQAVAIKVLRINLEDERRAEATSRFLREGQAAAALESDHVVRIHDVGTLDSGLPFMVMELLRGADLSSVLRRGVLPVATAVEYVLQACDAIAKAHAQGIVHRDLKPSNLFASQRGDGGVLIKVLDFGISKSTRPKGEPEGDLTATRTVLGSPFYMSPEQVRDARRVDQRTDIWALGAILHELLTGSPAFEGETLPGICAAIVADPPASLRRLRPDASEQIEAVVLRCLEKDPSRRFQCVEDLMAALYPLSERLAGRSSRVEPGLTPLPQLVEQLALPDARTLPVNLSSTPSGRDSTLPSEGVVRGSAMPSSGKRLHPRTEDAVAVEELPPPRERPPRAAALFVGASLIAALAAATYGILAGGQVAPASSPSSPVAPAASPAPESATEPERVAPEAASKPETETVAETEVEAETPPAPSTHSAGPESRRSKPKPKASVSAPEPPGKPPSELDIRLER